jgi:glyoxylase-like metal-dependent hydrolase (beta-lactamase superfamily II)
LHALPLPALNPGPYTGRAGNTTYLLPGAEPTLIDAGIGDPGHLGAIADALAGAPLAQVIVTHAHSDHASGAEPIAARWPGARFLKMPWPGRDARYGVPWQPLKDGDRIRAGDAVLDVLHTPGHAPDHIALWHAGTRTLFSGDLVVKGTTVVIPGTRGGSLLDYLRSLERLLALAPAELRPSHGPAIPERDIERMLRAYIDHRHGRERQIVELLRAAPRTADALVAAMYPAAHPQLTAAARDTIVAHLVKLQVEERVTASADPAADSTEWTLKA